MTSPSTLTSGETKPQQNGNPFGSPLKLALICDFLEEGWPSMDLFGDMLFQAFTAEHAAAIAAEQLRPAMHSRFTKTPGLGRSGIFRNADRLLNRFHDYPVWLKKRAARFDLFHLVDHSYAQLLLDLPRERTVVTCHDLDTFSCLIEPAANPRPRWFRAMARRTLNGFLRASHVICPSAFTRTNLLQHGLFPPDRVVVIPPGVDPVFFAAPEPGFDESVVQTLGLGGQAWLLHVGSTIARKRIDVLLQVFARVSAALPGIKLLRVGGALTPQQAQLAHRLDLDGKIVQAPRLTKAQLAAVYRSAALVLQPSGAEGFGLPVIESMACGCPVIASDIPPLREAGGAAAEYCPVAGIDAWSDTAIRLLGERETAPRDWALRRDRARQHARGYTWTENANRTISVYQSVCASGVCASGGWKPR